jgi:hypothetical protein
MHKAKTTGWDFLYLPIKNYIDTLKDKDIAILIQVAGIHMKLYLLEQGFTNVTVIDIAQH